MKPIKCRICGNEEWGHVCGGEPERKITEPQPAPRKITQPCEECARLRIENEELRAEISERKKMNAEYVRKFRAKKKDALLPKDSSGPIRADS